MKATRSNSHERAIRRVKRFFAYLIMILFSFVFFMPLYWMVTTALKDPTVIFLNPPQMIPLAPQWKNFIEVFQRMPVLSEVVNTLIVSILPVVGELFSAPMVAYSLTKIPWKGSKYIFPLILSTMMIPWQVTQIPMFSTWSRLGLVNTFVPLVLPAFFGGAYYVYLMRQFIKGLPDSVVEAARIDGAGEFQILYRLVYPMCKPVMTTIGVLIFMSSWNDLNGPLLYLQDSSKYTLSIGLQMFAAGSRNEWALLMAASFIVTIPLILLFFVAQKQILSGIAVTSGLK